ncbi:MAG: hypothetical protein IJO18_04330 [Alphaproteobacteria bacterium]|nr:hypothetical protein [Alphaproteobacteria bacterium]
MKVKNIMFAGFASAILSGVCGAASAADYNLVTEGYVTEKLAGKADTGASYTKSETDTLLDGKVSTGTYAAYIETQEGVDEAQDAKIQANTAAIDGLSGVDGTGFATMQQDISTLKTAVNDENGAVAQKIATAIAAEELRADGKYQEKGDYALKSELPTDYVTSEGLAAEGFLKAETAATTYQPIGDYQPAGSYVTTDGLAAEGFLKAETAATTYQPIGDYQPAGSYVTTDGLSAEGFLKATTAAETYQPKGNYQEAGDYVTTGEMETALQDKQDVIENLATIEANAAKGATAVQPGANVSVLVNDSGFQTAENVNTLIGQAQIAESQVTGLTEALAGKQAAGDYLEAMENAGTYLVNRDGEGNISYVSVKVIDANGDAI